jgi:aspartate/methionine/tyrosine aminotransferase
MRSARLEQYLSEFVPSAKIPLGLSDCDPLHIKDIFSLDEVNQLASNPLTYCDPCGIEPLRLATSALYKKLGANQVLIQNGGEEAIFLALSATLQSSDHVVVHAPAYPSLCEIPRSLGCKVSLWVADESKGWALAFDKLKKIICPQTRVIILNLPHNPTGYVMPYPEFFNVIQLARTHGIYLFVDEVYRMLEVDLNLRLPNVADLYEKGISIGSFSKTFGIAGARVGWVGTRDPTILRKIKRMKAYTSICTNILGQRVALKALEKKDEILLRNRNIIQKNTLQLEKIIARYADVLSWIAPKGGTVAFPRLQKGDTDLFCKQLLKKTGILLVPSSKLSSASAHFRIGLGRSNFAEGIAILGDFIGNQGISKISP